MNTFGQKLTLTTFGESHGVAIGGVLDGFPSGVKIDTDFLQNELDKRRPGRNKFATARNEADKVEIFSGVFEGVSTGTPIGFAIFNQNQKSNDYENLREIFRPGHADYTYFKKYAVRDHRGGGRSSARETAVRVVGGAFAQMMLDEFNITVKSGLLSVGDVKTNEFNWELAKNSEIFSLGNEDAMKELIMKVREEHDSIGACVLSVVSGAPTGLGEGLYDKLDARLAAAMMGVNGVKAIEIGEGINAAYLKGSQNNDQMGINGFYTNHSGGILGGMSNGEDIIVKSYFKPTPSIFKAQKTLNLNAKETEFELRGRHDPCIGVRGSVVATAMIRLVIADFMLLNLSSNIQNIKQIYR
ncbi:chorismate synthase [Campylobacter sp. RM9344]|uniref:Chorismate synthase n=1 Tax=Campylobacter californiensis TaxID=1032243 RepID=A0AAW3ZY99_9BACT|nr:MULTISPECIES: chorismate synthase [unclassified Campylobacter]MBE2984933.1 chorismate synthase [Campylobacter sp. RM6883]MBE2986720.1 chorismate synthase [Campylobacter sp. RM12919]MBE2989004.1 chorismate synthase [Campylobacter sp. RM12920]MBE2995375.1 chorismate synthase [Campylobacter sp. RM6913]MBE3022879.1 chorismate synthase [Campylobacter sp. 7477a]MBE3029946.1 chorismate synthase [Campylobacter sp. RM9344]